MTTPLSLHSRRTSCNTIHRSWSVFRGTATSQLLQPFHLPLQRFDLLLFRCQLRTACLALLLEHTALSALLVTTSRSSLRLLTFSLQRIHFCCKFPILVLGVAMFSGDSLPERGICSLLLSQALALRFKSRRQSRVGIPACQCRIAGMLGLLELVASLLQAALKLARRRGGGRLRRSPLGFLAPADLSQLVLRGSLGLQLRPQRLHELCLLVVLCLHRHKSISGLHLHLADGSRALLADGGLAGLGACQLHAQPRILLAGSLCCPLQLLPAQLLALQLLARSPQLLSRQLGLGLQLDESCLRLGLHLFHRLPLGLLGRSRRLLQFLPGTRRVGRSLPGSISRRCGHRAAAAVAIAAARSASLAQRCEQLRRRAAQLRPVAAAAAVVAQGGRARQRLLLGGRGFQPRAHGAQRLQRLRGCRLHHRRSISAALLATGAPSLRVSSVASLGRLSPGFTLGRQGSQ